MLLNRLIPRAIIGILIGLVTFTIQAGTPLWTFEPLTATTVSVPSNGSALIQYQITNQSSRHHTLTMQPIQGITQITAGLGVCSNPFTLLGKSSCILSLQVNGAQLSNSIANGPIVCQQGSYNQCYRPSAANILLISQAPPLPTATITVTGSPLTLTVNGMTGVLTINNTSMDVTATNITSNFSGTALAGNVTETGNTCNNVAPGGSCTLTYTPGNTVVPQTNFSIQGSNTNAETAAIAIQSGSTLSLVSPNNGTASGGVGVTLTGTGLTGATGVTFDGVAATSVNVVNSTTVTAVTPAHVAGAVNVAIATPAGGATLPNGFTYLATAVGQPSGGGTIACLDGGLQNLIAATVDNSNAIEWGGFGIITSAQSLSDGATNTSTIVTALGANLGTPYSAQLCSNFEIDSQGNTSCSAGNTCYNDWFLPAQNQLNCLYNNQVAIQGFSMADYWSSTESLADQAGDARYIEFVNGVVFAGVKNSSKRVRCVRVFTP